jgi:hypothetical protein
MQLTYHAMRRLHLSRIGRRIARRNAMQIADHDPDGRKAIKRVVMGTATVVVECAVRAAISQIFLRYKGPVLQRVPLDFDHHSSTMSDAKFRRLYRMSKQSFAVLAGIADPRLRRRIFRSGIAASVDVKIMLAVTLRLLAGASYLDVGWPYGIAESTVYRIADETLQAIDEALDNIQFPSCESKRMASIDPNAFTIQTFCRSSAPLTSIYCLWHIMFWQRIVLGNQKSLHSCAKARCGGLLQPWTE